MKVLITGGTGFVGKHLVRALLSEGTEVHLLVRDEKKAVRMFGSDVVVHRVDFYSKKSLSDAFAGSGARVLIHLIGILFEVPSRGITFERVHFEIAKNLYEVAREMGIRKIVHMSALGTSDNSPSKYHRTKRMAEKLLMESGLNYVILRPSLILGPEQKLFKDMDRITRILPVVALPGGGGYLFQPVSVRDVADSFVGAVKKRKWDRKILSLCGPQRVSFRKLLEDTFGLLGRKVLMVPLPKKVMFWTARAVETLIQPPPFSSDQMLMMWKDNICGLDPEEIPDGVKCLTEREPEDYHEALRWSVEEYLRTSS